MTKYSGLPATEKELKEIASATKLLEKVDRYDDLDALDMKILAIKLMHPELINGKIGRKIGASTRLVTHRTNKELFKRAIRDAARAPLEIIEAGQVAAANRLVKIVEDPESQDLAAIAAAKVLLTSVLLINEPPKREYTIQFVSSSGIASVSIDESATHGKEEVELLETEDNGQAIDRQEPDASR